MAENIQPVDKKRYTDFMKNLEKFLIDKKKVTKNGEKTMSPSTVSKYIQLLSIINGGPYDNLLFLKNTDDIIKFISKYNITTQKTFYACIISVLRSCCNDNKNFNIVIDKYSTEMKKIINEYNDIPKNKKTEKQKNNWIDWETILKKKDDYEQNVIEIIKDNKKKDNEELKYDDLTQKDYTTILKYVILSLYTYIEPRRNEYIDIFIIPKDINDETREDLLKNKLHLNYYDQKNGVLVFNKYKTSTVYGTQKIDIKENPLADILDFFITLNPLKKDNDIYPLFVTYKKKKVDNNNFLTIILNNIFKKKVGPSMIRNIYLTHKYSNSINDIKKSASNMGTSVEEITDVYSKF